MESGRINSILFVKVSPLAKQDHERLQQLVADLVRDDPTLVASAIDGGMIVSGEDEERLDAVSERLRDSQLASVGPVRVRYRETIRQPAEAEGKYIRQTAGRGNYAHCKIRVEPSQSEFAFSTEIQGGVVPAEFFASIENGIREASKGGILTGSEMNGFRVTLIDGSYHEIDSNEMAFSIAASLAFKEAARKARPAVLEPIMSVCVTVPKQFASRITGEIARRRGIVLDADEFEDSCLVSALLPLAETLRSSRYGRFAHPMRFAGYDIKASEGGNAGPDAAVPVAKPHLPKGGSSSATADPEG